MKKLISLFIALTLSVGAKAEDIPNDEIWYTSRNGNVVTPYNSGAFGANIVSNTYTNGKGIIKFNGNVTSIGSSAFDRCSGLTSVTIGNSVTSIGNYAFYDCSGLTSMTIPNSVTSIGSCAFERCSGLTSVTIGNSVTSIGGYAFSECSGLTSVTIPNSVTSIKNDAFYGCGNVKELIYAEGTKIVLRTYLTSITSVTIPNSVTEIENSAFYGCSGLTSVTIPNSVIEIGISAFYGCSSLTSVIIGNSVTSIGICAFERCSGLTSVTIGNSVTSIGGYAFSECSGLSNIIADGINAPMIGPNCFSDVSDCSLNVPLGSEDAYASNFGTRFTIETYSTYSKNSAGEYSFEEWGSSSNVTLSEGIEKVYVPVEATVNKLQYERTFNNTDWQALYVPFELDVKTDLSDFDVYKISASSADAINATLMTEGKTSANTPYLMKAKATGEQTISVSSKTVKVTVENTNSELSDFEIVGTYERLNYGDIDGDWYALKDGKFMKAGEDAYLNPYRFYLKRKASSSKESIEINLYKVTGIEAVQNAGKPANNDKRYNLQGIEVNENYNGMIIMNGKKYLNK